MALYLGLMSGTSLDGVDAVLARVDSTGLQLLAHRHQPFSAPLVAALQALNSPGPDELHRAALAANAVALAYAGLATQLLQTEGVAVAEVRALGAHGQTVRHQPGQHDGTGYTVQLLNAALLAERSGLDVVYDLRSRDVAAGGQGAPLVPAFHAAQFGRPGQALAVLNLGGIANLTLLDEAGKLLGFDCGPANTLLDDWCRRHRGQPFDADGAWAAGGQVLPALLARLLAEPFFALPPPKSTGRDLFNQGWLNAALAGAAPAAPQDVQATLAELSAMAAAQALQRHLPQARQLLVCGGGAYNGHLMRRLAALLPGVRVDSTAASGMAPEHVEAAAFAWLAHAFLERQPGNRPEVTGAAGPRVLGALAPAR